ncbi:MAG: hypothetical protein WBM01_28585 [Mycobacterium sp.]
MSGIELPDVLAAVRLPAVDELLSLMRRVNVADLTTPEVVALVAVFSAADRRVNARAAPVLALIPRDGGVSQP